LEKEQDFDMSSTLIQKNLMALTGLFLSFFLVIHLAGNLQLLLPEERASVQFNIYSKILSGNYIIKAISYLLFLSIAAHTAYALMITLKNRKASGGAYALDKRQNASPWYSRNMGILGSIILLFLIVHLKDFWYVYSFGNVPLDVEGNKDLFTIVINAYGQIWYIILNVFAFIALGYHMLHGIYSAFKTLGAYPSKLSKILYFMSVGLTAGLTFGFIFIPIFVFIKYHV
jgi:succinate dehydrogenase / fumarate reductase cytochrome b subunit